MHNFNIRANRIFIKSLVIAVLCILQTTLYSSPAKLVEIIIPKQDKSLLKQLMTAGFDITGIDQPRDICQVLLTEEEFVKLNTITASYKLLSSNIDQAIRDSYYFGHRDQDLGAYHTYAELTTDLQVLAAGYPDICRLDTIGLSLENRVIWGLKISDNVDQFEADEPEVLYLGNHHAREVISVEVPYYFAEFLITNYNLVDRVTDIVNNRQIWIVPMVNPDGHVYVETTDLSWRKNRRDNGDGSRGVDLNRNYSYQWGYDNIGSSPDGASGTYRGTAPFSEPETQAIRDLVNNHNFVVALTYHAWGELYIYPWGYIDAHCSDHDIFHHIGLTCSISNNYVYGNSWETLNYLMNGEAVDWLYGDSTGHTPILALTVEVGNSNDHFHPDPQRIPVLVNQQLEPNLWVAEIADNPAVHVPQSPQPVFTHITALNNDQYQLHWQQVDAGLTAGFRLSTLIDGYWSTLYDEDELAPQFSSVILPANFDTPIRLSTVDTTINSGLSYPSDTYHIYSDGQFPQVLIVDGFTRTSGSRSLPFHNFVTTISEPLKYFQWNLHSCSNQAVIDTLVNLSDYFAVFWILGDESTADETFSSQEQQLVKEYLRTGGQLFVSGSEIGWDLDHRGSDSDRNFYSNFLKAQFIADDAAILRVKGLSNDLFSGFDFHYGDRGNGSPYSENYPDVITPNNGARSVLRYAGSDNTAAILYEGIFNGGTAPGRLLYFAFPFETIHSVTVRQNLMYEILYQFYSPVGTVGNLNQPLGLSLAPNYPNPFNTNTTVIFKIGDSRSVTARIYNLAGELVRSWYFSDPETGEHRLSWDGKSTNSTDCPSGLYLLRLQAGHLTSSQKLMLLK